MRQLTTTTWSLTATTTYTTGITGSIYRIKTTRTPTPTEKWWVLIYFCLFQYESELATKPKIAAHHIYHPIFIWREWFDIAWEKMRILSVRLYTMWPCSPSRRQFAHRYQCGGQIQVQAPSLSRNSFTPLWTDDFYGPHLSRSISSKSDFLFINVRNIPYLMCLFTYQDHIWPVICLTLPRWLWTHRVWHKHLGYSCVLFCICFRINHIIPCKQ